MDADIAAVLVQDGVVNGAVYALLALSLVLVFATTRVVLIPQGEFVAFGALTYAALDAGQVPGSVYLLGGLGLGACAAGLWEMRGAPTRRGLVRLLAGTVLLPAVAIAAVLALHGRRPGAAAEAALALAIVAPMAPYVYRIAFRPMAEASVLVLLIAAVGVHLALGGLGLLAFGPEGARGQAFSTTEFSLGPLDVPGQALWVLGLTAALMGGLFALFEFTLTGKALRATAVNRMGARLVGISPARSGTIAFTLAGAIGALSGVLIAPLTTVYYDSGFLIGLKGFTAAIMAGMASYPGAAAAALLVGVIESFASFWASGLKEVIVFSAIIPVLLWRSLARPAGEDEE